MSTSRFVGVFAGAALLVAAPVLAQAAAPAAPPCAIEPIQLTMNVGPGAPADWSQEQVNARPQGAEIRDRDAYHQQVTMFYQRHLAAYRGEARRFAEDTQLLEQFKLRFQNAKQAVVRDATTDIARGVPPTDPGTGSATLADTDRQSPIDSTPVEVGNRDLATLANNVATDRAALLHSCEVLKEDQKILDRIAVIH